MVVVCTIGYLALGREAHNPKVAVFLDILNRASTSHDHTKYPQPTPITSPLPGSSNETASPGDGQELDLGEIPEENWLQLRADRSNSIRGLKNGTDIVVNGTWRGNRAEINLVDNKGNDLLHLSFRGEGTPPRAGGSKRLGGGGVLVGNTKIRGWGLEVYGSIPDSVRPNSPISVRISPGTHDFKVWLNSNAILSSCYRKNGRGHVLTPSSVSSIRLVGDISNPSLATLPTPPRRPSSANNLREVSEDFGRKSEKSEKKRALLLIAILSSPGNREKREIQRDTWAKSTPNVRIVYVIGTKDLDPQAHHDISAESHAHNDLLLLDHVKDHYLSLSDKVTGVMQAFRSLNPRPRFLLKTDDDMFIRVDNVVVRLQEVLRITHEQDKLYYWSGHFATGGSPIRRKESKYYLPRSEYASDFFPVFAFGPAYVLSGDLVGEIVREIKSGIQVLRLEDVTVGIWIKAIEDSGIKVWRDPFPGMGCTAGYAIHGLTKEQINCIWDNQQTLVSTNEDKSSEMIRIENICCGCPSTTGGIMGLDAP